MSCNFSIVLLIGDTVTCGGGGGGGAGTPGDQGGGGGGGGAGARENRGLEGYGRWEKKGREAGSLRWGKAGQKFKKASFQYLLLLTSSQRNEPNNVS